MPVSRAIGKGLKGIGKGVKKGSDTLSDFIRSTSPHSPNNSSDNVWSSPNSTTNSTNEDSKQIQNDQTNDSLNPKHDNSFNSDKESITSNPKTTKSPDTGTDIEKEVGSFWKGITDSSVVRSVADSSVFRSVAPVVRSVVNSPFTKGMMDVLDIAGKGFAAAASGYTAVKDYKKGDTGGATYNAIQSAAWASGFIDPAGPVVAMSMPAGDLFGFELHRAYDAVAREYDNLTYHSVATGHHNSGQQPSYMAHPISISTANMLHGGGGYNANGGMNTPTERTSTSAGASSFAYNTVFHHSQNQSRQLENLNDGLDSLIDTQMDLYNTNQTNKTEE